MSNENVFHFCFKLPLLCEIHYSADSVNSENARQGICVTGEMQMINAACFLIGSEKLRNSYCGSPARYILN